MHELSIAMSIVEIAEENAIAAKANSINEIELEIGELSGVVYEALEFAMQEAVKNTMLKNALRKVIKVPGKAKCLECMHEFGLSDLYTACPGCNSFSLDIIQGREMRVKSLVAE